MNLTDFEYRSARTVEEALDLYGSNDGARYLAGGTDLLPQVRCGAGQAAELVIDIKRIPGFCEIGETDAGDLRIGPTASIASLVNDERIRKHYPALADCAVQLGSYPLRNIATVAGNICNASPCADTAAALLALEARVEVTGVDGVRQVNITDFFQGPGMSALKRGELVTGILLPKQTRDASAHYGRIARRKGVDISTVAVLVAHLPSGDPRHRISMLSVAPTPLRVPEAERLLDEQGAAGAEGAAEICREACSPIDDLRATAAYRRKMVGVLVERAVAVLSKGKGS